MKKHFIIIFLLFVGFSVWAQTLTRGGDHVYTVSLEKEPVRIGKYFSFFEDKSGIMSFQDVLARGTFSSKGTDIPNFNVTSAAVWGKIKLTCSTHADWYLEFDPASFNKVVFFQGKKSSGWKKDSIGNSLPVQQRPLKVNHYFLQLKLSPGDTSELYFLVKDYYPMQFDIHVGSLNTFISPMHESDVYNGICYGIMIMMLIYNFYLYISQKAIVYLYYVLYVFFSMIFSAYLGGYALHFPAWLLKPIQFAPIIPPACFGVFGLLFTLYLFKEVFSERFKKIVYLFMIIAIADTILSATPLVHLSENIIQPLGLLLGILCISGAIIALRKKHSSAIYYLVGFGAYMSSLFYLICSAQGLFVSSRFTWHALATGSAIESIMLSFALGDKLKVSLREKEKAQEEAVRQATENERLVKEQNIVLEQKVKERTQELEEKNKEVLDSIYYARRIQHALLAHDEFLKKNLPEYFVFFKPKDIVSGDFYWATEVTSGQNAPGGGELLPTAYSQLFFLAVCDSTGHGVPGAFMSLLNISFLNEAITEKKILEPGKVFDHVRTRLIENISQEGGKDGMDGILCCLDKSSNTLTYAAANNAPVFVRKGESVPLAKDKMPVGKGEKSDTFTTYKIHLEKGDCIYFFTDGYGDQFGGPKGKKFKSKKLEEKLISISGEPLIKQQQLLEAAFYDWKGNLEQVDDVLVIGIRC